RGLCRLPAHSVGRGHRRWLWPGANLPLAGRSPEIASGSPGSKPDGGLFGFARNQSLRRSSALGRAEIGRLHGSLISECDEVSAVIVVPVDDARSGFALPV